MKHTPRSLRGVRVAHKDFQLSKFSRKRRIAFLKSDPLLKQEIELFSDP
jgi:hypothetical protein